MDLAQFSAHIEKYATQLSTWIQQDVLSADSLAQVALLILGGLVANIVGGRIAAKMRETQDFRYKLRGLNLVLLKLAAVVPAVVLLFILAIASFVLESADVHNEILDITISLTVAWIAIRLISGMLAKPLYARYFAFFIWLLAALNILGLLAPTVEFMDNAAVELGDLRLSLLGIIKGIITLAILMWLATMTSNMVERQLKKAGSLTPSIKVLLSKLVKITLIVIAGLAAISSVGIDISAIAVFSGAVGVGLGFGLQKVVSNFISGIILLLDRSIKPGDVIEIGGDTYGWVTSLNSRYVSLVTRDGTEYLVPNEDLITQQVVNWSYTNKLVRQKCPFGVSYKSDLRKVQEVCVKAVEGLERVTPEKTPLCLIKGFGDSSVDMELRFWITDPENGVSNIKSAVYMKIWDALHENDIEIPYPQRDLHVKSVSEDVNLS